MIYWKFNIFTKQICFKIAISKNRTFMVLSDNSIEFYFFKITLIQLRRMFVDSLLIININSFNIAIFNLKEKNAIDLSKAAFELG